MFHVTGYNSIRSMSFSVRVDEKRRADERRAATATARHTAAARARAARRIALRGPVRPKGVTLYAAAERDEGGDITGRTVYLANGRVVELRRMPAFRERPYVRPEDRAEKWAPLTAHGINAALKAEAPQREGARTGWIVVGGDCDVRVPLLRDEKRAARRARMAIKRRRGWR